MRRTNIKDLSAFCGFLVGFLGSAPFAWLYLGAQLEGGDFVRGLWFFFAIVLASAVFAGTAGLGAGILIGWVWERYHRHRRLRRQRRESAAAGESSRVTNTATDGEDAQSAIASAEGMQHEPPRLRLLTATPNDPDPTVPRDRNRTDHLV